MLVGHACIMVAMEAPIWQGAWWSWPYCGGHGSIMVAGYVVAIDIPWWQGAWYPWLYRGGNEGYMVAMEVLWWPWRQCT